MAAPRGFISKLVRRTALFLAITYAAIAATAFLLQARLIYHPDMPSRAVTATPEQIGLAYEAVDLTTEDGLRLDGWFVPAEEARGVVLFFHGNGGNISHRLDTLRILHGLGLSTFIFDYRGFGRSEGEPSEQGTYRDAEAAWRYLTDTRGIDADQIVVFGRSLGGSVAAHQAMKTAPRALILESTFTSAPDIGARAFPYLPVRWLTRFRYDTRAYVESVSVPVLIVHSPDDQVIAYRHGRDLLAAANAPKAFLRIAGGHGNGFIAAGRTYIDGIDAFLRTYLDR